VGEPDVTSAADRAREVELAAKAFTRATSGGVRVTIFDDAPAGGKGFDRVFAGLGATLDAMPAALRAALPVLEQAFGGNFTRQGARAPWAALAPSTQQERRRLGYGPARPILVRTGGLRGHVLAATRRATITKSGSTVRLVVDPRPGMPKYAWLAGGTSRMPARPMVVVTPDQATKVTSAVSRHLRTVAAMNGLR
jgi:hypothetical protein